METFFYIDYPTWWYLVVGFLFSGYAILDGFVYGAGAWHLFFRNDLSRRIAINAIGPVWDANQVWLIIGAGALFAGFPVMYAALLSGMYIPVMLLLMMLIFRSVAIKFRSAEPMKWWRSSWDVIYCAANVMIALLLGIVLGNILQGFAIGPNQSYEGGAFFSFLTPYPIMVGITTLALFMMHGAIYLLLKTEGALYEKLTRLMRGGMIFFLVSFAFTSLYTLIFVEGVVEKFRQHPEFFVLPVLSLLSIANVPRLVSQKKYFEAFIFSSLTMAFLLMLVAFHLYPTLLISTIDPAYSITIYNAASSTKTLRIMLTFVLISMPLIAMYFVFLYRTFRGKVRKEELTY